MKNSSVREMAVSGLFIAMGLVLPTIFHFFNLGKTFLPMHIPVILAGFLLNTPYAVLVGAITPLLSSIITGMPPLMPVMPYMVFELAAYAAVASILSRKLNMNVYITLVASMVSGRIVAGLVVWIMVELFGINLPNPLTFIITALTTGVPGILIQLIFIPPMVLLLNKTSIFKKESLKVE